MPILQISTNVPRAKITEEINLQLADLVANMLGKPKGNIEKNNLLKICFR